MNFVQTDSFAHPSKMKQQKIKPEWIIFVSFFLIIVILHLLAGRPLQADDHAFHDYWFGAGFNLFEWLSTRYATWSSRIIIEFIMMLLLRVPFICFCLINSFVITLSAYLLYRIFAPQKNNVAGGIIACLLWLCIPLKLYTSVGWVAGSLNYVWPLAALLGAFLPFQKLTQNRRLSWYEYVISIACAVFATQSEQTAVLLLAVSAAFLIYTIINKQVNAYAIILLCVSAVGALFVFSCPGNALRTAHETVTWFPEYADFSLIDKFDLSFSAVTWNYYYNLPIFAILVSGLSFLLVLQKSNSLLIRLISLFPIAFTMVIVVLFQQSSFSIFSINGDGIYSQGHLSAARFLFYGALLLSFCILILNVYVIFGNKIQALIGAGTLLLGFASQAALGFSPTVWASGERTGFIMFVGICAAFLLLLNRWDFKSKQSTSMLVLVLGFLAGYTTLNQLFLLSPYLQ